MKFKRPSGELGFLVNLKIYSIYHAKVSKGQIQLPSQSNENSMLNEPITFIEVEYAINNLKFKKSSGIDNIPNEI